MPSSSPSCKPVHVTLVMHRLKLWSKAWRLIRCYIFIPKKLQYLKSEKYPQWSAGRHWVVQPNQKNWERHEWNEGCELCSYSYGTMSMLEAKSMLKSFFPRLSCSALQLVGLSIFIILSSSMELLSCFLMCVYTVCTILLERHWDLSQPKVKKIRT